MLGAEIAAEVQACFAVLAVGRELTAEREVTSPRAAAGRHGDLHLRNLARREEDAGVHDEAIDQRGVDAVVHGVEEAVAAGGGGESAACRDERGDVDRGKRRRPHLNAVQLPGLRWADLASSTPIR